ncbi:precorrin-2 C(20)-methyltransferase [Nisaea acidiphila]|uniref:Precorrin-2 C(20)-methyltransferase n=1 Tax=Nisaea acidiphila TaxID=1862145 RepID=A0A9J7AL14_9PROT|nr:precorrin-2 C(20)-methyltransferase [Nisaea acidiphila]UUX48347.1 precorrin-2 C(20)-methyltransferase [Nisaea acidiphila]
MTGLLTGIGVGPGDPDLITLKALKRLQAADLVCYPAPEVGQSLARRIAAPHIPHGLEEYAIRMPMVASRFPAAKIYDEAALRIGAALDAGRNVVVLCEGDPFFYGSFMYLYERLAKSHSVEVVPGISSPMASAAALGAPLVSRNDILTVLPAPLEDAELRARLAASDGIVIMKIGRHFARIRDLLRELGLEDDARYIEHATMENQRCLALSEVDPETVPYFSMILLHKRGEAFLEGSEL